jgi:hypothetical protein
MKVSKSCLRRNVLCIIFFVGAFGVFLVRCRCFLATLLHLVVVFQHISCVLF